MSTLKSLDARIRYLRVLEAFCGSRPEITADIKHLTADRRRAQAENAQQARDEVPFDEENEPEEEDAE